VKKYFQAITALRTKAKKKVAMIGRSGRGSLFASVPICQSVFLPHR
jgi:hypothetical protein